MTDRLMGNTSRLKNAVRAATAAYHAQDFAAVDEHLAVCAELSGRLWRDLRRTPKSVWLPVHYAASAAVNGYKAVLPILKQTGAPAGRLVQEKKIKGTWDNGKQR